MRDSPPHRALVALAGPALALAALAAPAPARAELQNIDYAATDAAFPNPERGWYHVRQPGYASVTLPLDGLDFEALRARNVTMVRQVYVLDAWRERDLPDAFLEAMEDDLEAVRAAGFKMIPKFSYNWVHEVTGPEDATAARIARHLDRLCPVLRRHRDVVAFMEEGFVGHWGEWHDSLAGLVEPGTLWLSPDGVELFGRVTDCVPSRPWAARYAEQAMQVHPEPQPARSARDGSRRSRVGLFNAGLRSTPDDFGSWSGFDPAREAAQRAYARAQTRYTIQSGEPAGVPEERHRDHALSGPGLLADLERFGYAALAVNQTDAERDGQYAAWGIDDPGTDTPYAVADRRLGYRYRLVSAELPTDIGAGAPFGINVRVANDGWARLYNPRALELVFRPVGGGADVALDIDPDVDARARLPGPGEERTLFLPTAIPSALAAGEYELLLGLPDPAPALRDRPAYRIRLANAGTWEASTGLNRLNARVRVWP